MSRAVSSSAFAVAILGLSAGGCGGNPAPDAGADAGDAGALETGPSDAGRPDNGAGDAAAGDSSAVDASAPAWYRPDGLPDGCEVLAAADPRGLRPVVFEPCPDRPGCRWLRYEGFVEPDEIFRVGFGAGSVNEGMGTIPMRFIGTAHHDELVVREDGSITVALRTPRESRCILGELTTRGERSAGVIVDLVSDSGSDSYVWTCPLHPLPGRCRAIARWGVDELHGNLAQDIYAAETHIAVHTTPAQTAWRVEWDGSGRIPVGGWEVDRILGEPTAAARDATFYTLFGSRNVIGVSVGAAPGEPPGRPLVDDPSFDALIPLTDGTDLVWYQGYGRRDVNDFDRVEVWTSPFATTPDALAPRRMTVALLRRSGSLDARMGYGRFAHREGDVIAVYDLADGARHEIGPPEGEIWSGGIIYLGPEEIAVASGLPGARYGAQRTVMLIRYDSLGDPAAAPSQGGP